MCDILAKIFKGAPDFSIGDNVNPCPANIIYAVLDKQENPSFVYYVCKESQGIGQQLFSINNRGQIP